MLEIVYKSNESFSDSNSDSVSSSDNDTDNITLADVIINDDRGDEEQILHRDSGKRLWIITEDTDKCSVAILDTEMVQKM
jgi:hypothetical protein